jgi:multidrug efflux pump subunit AcrA (membrane-fusion protein)
MMVTPAPLVATATGYGRVEAVREWSAVSEVEGRINRLSEGLAEGTIVDAGQVIAEVDKTDYELSIQKTQANIAVAEAALAELDRQEANSKASLEVEERILAVAQAEVDRASRLMASGSGTQSSLDTAQRTLLSRETAVVALQNTLALYPSQRASAEAALALRQAELAEEQRSLGKTTLTAPFRARVSEVNIEEGQFIRVGDSLLTLEGTDAAEVVAEIQPRSFAPLVQLALSEMFQRGTEVDSTQVVNFLKSAGVTASVIMDLADFQATFPAELVRFRGEIDSDTGTLGIVVRVADPLMANRDRPQPPLNVGSFVSVVLQAAPVDGVIAIPRAAVHQDDNGAPFVFLSDADNRLLVQSITPGQVVDDVIVVRDGLNDGRDRKFGWRHLPAQVSQAFADKRTSQGRELWKWRLLRDRIDMI